MGPGVSDLEPGQRIVGYPLLGFGDKPFWRCGDDARGVSVTLGEQRNGACCEALTLPWQNLLLMPEGLSFEQAAAVPVAFLTAYTMLARAKLHPGETLLVLGAGSGVGTAAVQLGRRLGARVIACTHARKLHRVRELGADEVIDYRNEQIDTRVLALTGRNGADVVFEHVGEATSEQSMASAAYRGRLVTCGATTGRKAVTDLALVLAGSSRSWASRWALATTSQTC